MVWAPNGLGEDCAGVWPKPKPPVGAKAGVLPKSDGDDCGWLPKRPPASNTSSSIGSGLHGHLTMAAGHEVRQGDEYVAVAEQAIISEGGLQNRS